MSQIKTILDIFKTYIAILDFWVSNCTKTSLAFCSYSTQRGDYI